MFRASRTPSPLWIHRGLSVQLDSEIRSFLTRGLHDEGLCCVTAAQRGLDQKTPSEDFLNVFPLRS